MIKKVIPGFTKKSGVDPPRPVTHDTVVTCRNRDALPRVESSALPRVGPSAGSPSNLESVASRRCGNYGYDMRYDVTLKRTDMTLI